MKNRSRKCPRGPKRPDLDPRGAKAPPKGGQGVLKWHQREAEGCQNGPKEAQRSPRWRQEGPKGGQMTPFMAKRGEKGFRNRCQGTKKSENTDFVKTKKNLGKTRTTHRNPGSEFLRAYFL